MPNKQQKSPALEVFLTFLRLGLSAFGGPMAHIGYFRTECVEKRGWLNDQQFADYLALCQFLPGPSSSQLGFLLGMQRAGFLGAVLAFLAFTLPSAAILIGLALFFQHDQSLTDAGWVHGLKVVTVAVVAHAVLGMAQQLTPDWPRRFLALLAMGICVLLPITFGQPLALLVCAFIAWRFLRNPQLNNSNSFSLPVSTGQAHGSLILLLLLSLGFFFIAFLVPTVTSQLLAGFYQTGILVFGGGHVMLPLLQGVAESTQAIAINDFLAGYGAAQAIPGPLFTFAAYLGVVADWPLQGITGGLLLLVVIFLPGLLLLIGILPYWQRLQKVESVQWAMAGINAAVVGLLAAALYNPIITAAIFSWMDALLALLCFMLLRFSRFSPIWVVMLAALLGWFAG